MREVAHYARSIHSQGLVLNHEGNVSLRLPDQLVAITPSQVPKPQLREEDILLVNLAGKVAHGTEKPSSELAMHLAVYSARKEVNTIMHTHSTYASAIAAARQTLPIFLDEQRYFLGGAIRTAEYAPPGSIKLGKSAVKGLGDNLAVLLANHGALTCGANLQDAFRNAVLLEHCAQIYLLSKLIGGPVELPKSRSAAVRSDD